MVQRAHPSSGSSAVLASVLVLSGWGGRGHGPHQAEAALTWDEAKCVVAGRRVVFVGDSVSRFNYFELTNFVATGALRAGFKETDAEPWGYGANSSDYDTVDAWTSFGRMDHKTTHQQHFVKALPAIGATTEFFFASNVWISPDMDALAAWDEADAVIFNGGLWFLVTDDQYMGTPDLRMACGETFDAACAAEYRRMVKEAVSHVFAGRGLENNNKNNNNNNISASSSTAPPPEDEESAATATAKNKKETARVWRGTWFGGTSKSSTKDADWAPAIGRENGIARSVLAKADMDARVFVDVAPLMEGRTDATFDGRHPNVATCHDWNELVLREVDRQLGTRCFEGEPPAPTVAPKPAPTRRPTRWPTLAPTQAPTQAPFLSPPRPTQRPTTLTPTPAPTSTRRPTLMPTLAPSRAPSSLSPPSHPPSAPPSEGARAIPTPSPSSPPTILSPAVALEFSSSEDDSSAPVDAPSRASWLRQTLDSALRDQNPPVLLTAVALAAFVCGFLVKKIVVPLLCRGSRCCCPNGATQKELPVAQKSLLSPNSREVMDAYLSPLDDDEEEDDCDDYDAL